MSASYTPVEADEGDYLRATASYTDGHGSGKSASATTAMTAGPVTFAISGPSDPSYNYMENGTDAVGTYTASGPGATSAIWTLEGADAGDFVVEGSGASVMLKFSSPPDYENAEDSGTDNTYLVTLKATAGTYMDRYDVTSGHQRGRTWDAVRGFQPQLRRGRRGRRGDLHGLGRLDVGHGQLVAGGRRHGRLEHQHRSGELTFDATPDYEMPMDKDMDNTYKVTVMAEAGGEMKEIAVIVMVTNANENGTVTLMPASPIVGTEISAALTDPDMMVTGTTWQWSRSMTMGGTYEDIDMATSMTYTPMTADVGYYLRATVMYTDGHDSGKTAMATTTSTVTAAGDPLLAKYDGNGNGMIDKDRVIAAINRLPLWRGR